MGKFLEACYGDLALYVRQLAWLRAVPKQEGRAIVVLGDPERFDHLTNEDRIKKDGGEPMYPPLDEELRYLIRLLWTAGPVLSVGMGAYALTEQELEAFQRNRGLTLQPFEVDFVKRLSQEYATESEHAKKPGRKPPYSELSRIDRAAVARKLDEAMGFARGEQ